MNTWLQTKTWKEAKEAIEQSKGVAVLSIGSVEQHSYHLPVGTDSYVAIALAEEACQKTNALLVPPIWFGWSPHHMVLPGTITIKAETMIALTLALASFVEIPTLFILSKYMLRKAKKSK